MAEPVISFEAYASSAVTNTIINAAAILFSENYGIWGPEATAHAGKRVKMSPRYLRLQCLPNTANGLYIRALIDGVLVGNVFACDWDVNGRQVRWVTQLVVKQGYRSRGVATELLRRLRDTKVWVYGVLSSHAHTCMAAVKAFGGSVESVSLDFVKEHARELLAASPVDYVRNAKLHGDLFDGAQDGSISSADTKFLVDHTEPRRALELVKGAGINWPFGTLARGHEFLVIIEAFL